MIAEKKKFATGLFLIITFTVVFIAIFMPLYGGHNGLQYLDNLYNSISKGSAQYIPKAAKAVQPFAGQQIEVRLKLSSDEQAEQTAKLFNAGGASTSIQEAVLTVSGDFGQIMSNCLADAQLMYDNNGAAVKGKYGYEERRAMFNWWKAGAAMIEALNKQDKFKQALAVNTVLTKAVEPAYNYYGIEGQKIGSRIGVVVFSLFFYVIYTLWYGFGIMYLFEGWGLRLEH